MRYCAIYMSVSSSDVEPQICDRHLADGVSESPRTLLTFSSSDRILCSLQNCVIL